MINPARDELIDHLRKSLLIAKAEIEALRTVVEEINGRAQGPGGYSQDREALSDIQAKCVKALQK